MGSGWPDVVYRAEVWIRDSALKSWRNGHGPSISAFWNVHPNTWPLLRGVVPSPIRRRVDLLFLPGMHKPVGSAKLFTA